MKYDVKLVYNDKESVMIQIRDNEMESFFRNLSAGEIYKEPTTKVGFWTNLSNIRYITVVEKEDENGPEQDASCEAGEGPGEVPGHKDCVESQEKELAPA